MAEESSKVETLVDVAQNFEGADNYDEESALYSPEGGVDPSVAGDINSDYLSEEVKEEYEEAVDLVAETVAADIEYEDVNEPENTGLFDSLRGESNEVAQRGVFDPENSETAQLVYEASLLAETADEREAIGYIASQAIGKGVSFSATNLNKDRTEYVIGDEVLEQPVREIRLAVADAVEQEIELDYSQQVEQELNDKAFNRLEFSADEFTADDIDVEELSTERVKQFADEDSVREFERAQEAVNQLSGEEPTDRTLERFEDSDLVSGILYSEGSVDRNDEAVKAMESEPSLDQLSRRAF